MTNQNSNPETSAAQAPGEVKAPAPAPTPGPWEITLRQRDGKITHLADYLLVNKRIDTVDEALANARLIAAAPALYEALRGMVEYAELLETLCSDRVDTENDPRLPAARAALSQAQPPVGG